MQGTLKEITAYLERSPQGRDGRVRLYTRLFDRQPETVGEDTVWELRPCFVDIYFEPQYKGMDGKLYGPASMDFEEAMVRHREAVERWPDLQAAALPPGWMITCMATPVGGRCGGEGKKQ